MNTFHGACSIPVCPNWCKKPHGQIITPCFEIFSAQVSAKRLSWADDKEDNNNLFLKFSAQANSKPLLWAENLTDSRSISAQERHNEKGWADNELPSANLMHLRTARQLPIWRDVIFCYASQAKRKRGAGKEKVAERSVSVEAG